MAEFPRPSEYDLVPLTDEQRMEQIADKVAALNALDHLPPPPPPSDELQTAIEAYAKGSERKIEGIRGALKKHIVSQEDHISIGVVPIEQYSPPKPKNIQARSLLQRLIPPRLRLRT